MCLKNGFIISGTEKYENPIFIPPLLVLVGMRFFNFGYITSFKILYFLILACLQ